MVVATTVVLVIEQAFFHSAIYADLFSAWAARSSGFKLLPWSKTTATVYLYFILPILLSTLTAIAIWFLQRKGALMNNPRSNRLLPLCGRRTLCWPLRTPTSRCET
jgi:hypothetical protein